jgi:dephospho-CoA kinase
LDKQKIASLIFNNPEALQKVNNFIHPMVNENFVNWINKQKNCFYVIKESALLLELKTKQDLDYVILVHAPLELRIERVMLRDGTDKETVLKRVNNQSPDEEKMKRASHIISNDDQSLLLPQVLALHKMYITESQNR